MGLKLPNHGRAKNALESGRASNIVCKTEESLQSFYAISKQFFMPSRARFRECRELMSSDTPKQAAPFSVEIGYFTQTSLTILHCHQGLC